VVGSAVFSLGVAPVGTLATDLIVGSVPPEKAGAASGISETSAEFGGALGIAVLGSIGTAVYRSRVGDALPAGVPPDAAEAARDTLGGAASAAEGLPDRLGAGLLDAAREAFTQGLHLAAVTSDALVLGMAVLIFVLLRDVRADTGPEGQPEPSLEGAVPGSTSGK
jgi:MFS transporter, DHA2 family, multidrug resistance protein